MLLQMCVGAMVLENTVILNCVGHDRICNLSLLTILVGNAPLVGFPWWPSLSYLCMSGSRFSRFPVFTFHM